MKHSQFLLIALLTCVVSPARPQAPSAPATGGRSDRQIILDVVVTDKSGNIVSGLQQQDFSIFDNTHPQEIAAFHAIVATNRADDPPVRVVFVIDEVNVSFRGMGNARLQLERFLRQDEGRLSVPMSLVVFSEKSTQVQGTPTRDGNVLGDSVHAISAGAPRELEGTEFENRIWRLQISLRALGKLVAYEGTQPGRKLLIWLSPGWPLITESADKLTAKDLQTDFHSLVTLNTELRKGRITLYSIDPFGMDDAGGLGNVYYQNFLNGVPSANKFQSGNLTIPVIATQSGGQVLNRSNDVASLIRKCVADTGSYYTLAFDPGPARYPDEYHDLEVKIDKPGLIARTRTGFYAQP